MRPAAGRASTAPGAIARIKRRVDIAQSSLPAPKGAASRLSAYYPRAMRPYVADRVAGTQETPISRTSSYALRCSRDPSAVANRARPFRSFGMTSVANNSIERSVCARGISPNAN